MFGDLLNVHRALDLVADKLLDFVDDNKRARKFSFVSENGAYEGERLVYGYTIAHGELRAKRFLCVRRATVGRITSDQRFRNMRGNVKISDLLVWIPFFSF